MADLDLSDLIDKPKAPARTEEQFSDVMDRTFGKGKWKETSGFRSKTEEDRLRRQGAGTVPPGSTSKHSTGSPEAPGARDVVVPGLSPEQIAAKLKASGAKFRHFFPEGAHGTQGAHLHVDTDLSPDPVDLSDLVAPARKPNYDSPSHAQLRQGQGPIGQFISDAKGYTGQRFGAAAADFDKSIHEGPEMTPLGLAKEAAETFVPMRALREAGDLVGMALSPVGGTVEAIAHRSPTGSVASHHPKESGDVAEALVPLPGPGGKAKLAEEALGAGEREAAELMARRAAGRAKYSKDPAMLKHGDAVARLHDRGVEMTPGQIKGGEARLQEEAEQSHPMKGRVHREGQDKSIISMNRAAYNEALSPLGIKWTAKEVPDEMIGRDGVDKLHETIAQTYEPLLPKIKAKVDAPFSQQIERILQKNEKRLGTHKDTLRAIIEDDVYGRFSHGDQTMDGRSWKEVQSDLAYESRRYHRSDNPDHQRLAQAIDEVNEALLQNTERHSDPSAIASLKKSNAAYASLIRIEEAAGRRATSGGKFTTGDLMAAIRKGDSSVRKNQFARGKALMQQFAEDANAVLPNKLPSSGTADRLMRNGFGPATAAGAGLGAHAGPLGAAVGAAAGGAIDRQGLKFTDAAYRALQHSRARQLLRGEKAVSPGTRNYLAQAAGRIRPVPGPAAVGVLAGDTQP